MFFYFWNINFVEFLGFLFQSGAAWFLKGNFRYFFFRPKSNNFEFEIHSFLQSNNECERSDDIAKICVHSQQEWTPYCGWSNWKFHGLRQKTTLGSFNMGRKATTKVSWWEIYVVFFCFCYIFFVLDLHVNPYEIVNIPIKAQERRIIVSNVTNGILTENCGVIVYNSKIKHNDKQK